MGQWNLIHVTWLLKYLIQTYTNHCILPCESWFNTSSWWCWWRWCWWRWRLFRNPPDSQFLRMLAIFPRSNQLKTSKIPKNPNQQFAMFKSSFSYVQPIIRFLVYPQNSSLYPPRSWRRTRRLPPVVVLAFAGAVLGCKDGECPWRSRSKNGEVYPTDIP